MPVLDSSLFFDGTVSKTFWADAFGMLTDRFGTPWMVMGGVST